MKYERFTLGPLSTNCYLIYNDDKKGFIIDPAYPSNYLLDYIHDNDIDIEFILITHSHIDHIAGIKFFKEILNTKLYAPIYSKDIINDSNYNLSDMVGIKYESTIIDRYIKDDEIFSDFNIKALFTPGHTLDSMCYKVDNDIFCGDLIFKLSIGRHDFLGGNYSNIITSIKNKIMVYDDSTVLHPGHGEQTTVGYERSYNPFLN